jgi:hypothetical protein
MENDGVDFFFGVPPLFVRKLTRDSVERAITALLDDSRGLETYGTLQASEKH